MPDNPVDEAQTAVTQIITPNGVGAITATSMAFVLTSIIAAIIYVQSLILPVGITANTVAAGNDSRITGAIQTSGGDVSTTIVTASQTISPQVLASAMANTGITPQMFGAKCDGITNDGPAMTAWANSVTANSYYSLAGKQCNFDIPLSFPLVSHVTINGNTTTLNYIGASTTSNLITIGTNQGGCTSYDWVLQNLTIKSSTTMTAGDALRINDVCASQFNNLQIGRLLNGDGTLWNGAHFNGGNSVKFGGGGTSAQNDCVLVNGDNPNQYTDFVIGGEMAVLGCNIGVHIAGNVGGFEGGGSLDILENHINVVIDQSQIPIANSQIFFDALTFIDITNGGAGQGFGIHVLDAGGSNSLLTLTGTWVASSQNTCIAFDPGTTWLVTINGGLIFNCGASGFYSNSTGVTANIVGTTVAQNVNFGINNPLGTVTKCGVLFKNNPTGNTSGTVGSSC